MSNLVITISREFGSGGRQVGEKLAEELGVAFFDKALIHLAVAKSGLDPATIENAEKEASSKFLFNLAIGGYVSTGAFSQISVPLSDQVFFAQSKVIEEIAQHGDCVIIGRCGNHILRDYPGCLRVFIYAEREDKVRRLAEENGISKEEAEAKMTRADKGRANYHEHYANETWGSREAYDLAINTSFSGIDGAVRTIRAMVQR